MITDMIRYLAIWVTIMILLFSFTMFPHLCSAASRYKEDEIKVVLIYHFTKFIEWPPEAFSDANAGFKLCIFGANPSEDALTKIQSKLVKGKPLVIQRVNHTAQLNTCHTLFVSASEALHVAPILAYVKTLPIVTISDLNSFTRMGGMFNFVRSKDTIGFEVNPKAARRAGVTIRSKLLRLAKTVILSDIER